MRACSAARVVQTRTTTRIGLDIAPLSHHDMNRQQLWAKRCTLTRTLALATVVVSFGSASHAPKCKGEYSRLVHGDGATYHCACKNQVSVEPHMTVLDLQSCRPTAVTVSRFPLVSHWHIHAVGKQLISGSFCGFFILRLSIS